MVSQQLVRLDVPIMIGVSLLVCLLASPACSAGWKALLLFAGIIVYVVFSIRQSRKESAAVREEYAQEFGDGQPHGAGAIAVQRGLCRRPAWRC